MSSGWGAWVVGTAVFVGVLALGVWLSHRMLVQAHRDGTATSNGGNALGGLAEIFDPGRVRAEHELESKKHQGEALPTPSDDDGSGRTVYGAVVERPGQPPRITIRRPTSGPEDPAASPPRP